MSVWLLLAGSLALLYGGSLLAHMRVAADPLIFNDDARQFTWLFLRGEGWAPDYLADYWTGLLPLGYRALYALAAIVVDPRLVGKALPYLLLVPLWCGIGWSAHRLGGKAAAWASLAFCLGSSVFLDRMSGGHPRAFGYPLVAGIAAALVAGRAVRLAALTAAAAALYPLGGALGGLSLAGLLALPAGSRGDTAGWRPGRRWALLLGTAALCAALLLPMLLSQRGFGPRLRAEDADAYPELAPSGRYDSDEDRPPFPGLLRELALDAPAAVECDEPWFPSLRNALLPWRPFLRATLLALGLAGLWPLARRDPAARRLLVLAAAMAAGHSLSRLAYPYLFLPPRYPLYAAPVLVLILLPAAWTALLELHPRWRAGPRAGSVAALAICLAQLALLGGRVPATKGFHIEIEPGETIYRFLASLPPGAMIAGWPGPSGVVDNVPYMSARSVLVSRECHEVFHRGYLDEMRRRVRAVLDAYFATETAPLLRLREEFGVTHLVVDTRHFSSVPIWYFRPFDAWIKEAYARLQGRPLELGRQAQARVFASGPLWVIDLAKLRAP